MNDAWHGSESLSEKKGLFIANFHVFIDNLQMRRLSIALLGGFRVAVAGKVVTQFESDKGRALLAYLVMNAERPYKRETLAALFWPDSPAKDGRNNLRQALFKLKRALQEGERPFFLTTRTTIQFNRQPDDWLDIEAISQADAAELLRIYTGPFLDQLYLDNCQAFEEWTLIQREWIHQQAMNRFYQLAETALAKGDYDTAYQLAARQISLDRWRETARRQLMHVLVGQKKYSAALAQYQICRAVLADELGVEPARETTDLYRDIQAGMQAPLPPAPRHNLPPEITPFIGRVAELEVVYDRLSDSACRLLTLTGPGGIGKTRLALHAAAEMTETFCDGIFFTPLASIAPDANPQEQIIHAIAGAVGLTFSGPTPPRRQLAGFLLGKRILLVVDNFEHMLEGAEAISYLLQTAVADSLGTSVGLKILITSRHRLQLEGEWLLPVRGLAYPAADDGDLTQFDAMKLFWQRARMANPHFAFSVAAEPFVAQICRMAGGHPLAITLAASWTHTLSCAEIAAEMKHDLAILLHHGGDVAERHQNLRVVLRQSWQKLSATAQAALLKLALFPGGFTRATATAVAQAGPFVLQELTDYAFLSRHADDRGRYRIHELLRHFAVDLLDERGETVAAKQGIMEYYGRFLQEKTPALKDERRHTAIRAIRVELDNIRACWRWACELGDVACLRNGLEAVFQFYELYGLFQEGDELFAAANEWLGDDGRFQARWGVFQYHLGQLEQSETRLKLALTQAEAADDALEMGFCAGQLGRLYYLRGRHDDAPPYLQRALTLSRSTGDLTLLALATGGLTLYHTRKGELETAAGYGRESLAIYKRLGNPLNQVAGSVNLANIALLQGQHEEAERLLRDCLAMSVRHQAGYAEMSVLVNLSLPISYQSRHEEAQNMLERALVIARAIGHRYGEGAILNNLGCLYYDTGLYDLAYATLQAALSVRREADDLWGTAVTQIHIGETLTAQNKLDEAESAILAGLNLAQEAGGQTAVFDALGALAALRFKQGDEETAVNLAQQVLDSAEATDGAKEKARSVLAG